MASSQLYGGSHNLLHYTLPRFGIETTYYDPAIGEGIKDLIKDNTRIVFVESPGSLTMEMQDVPAIAKAAAGGGARPAAPSPPRRRASCP